MRPILAPVTAKRKPPRAHRSRPSSAPTARSAAALPLFLAGVFLVKLIVVWQLHDHPLVQPDVGLDTTAYVTLARQVLAGNVLLRPGQYYVSPLYIYFLAACLGLLRSFTAVRVAQAALGTAGVFCVFLIARDWFGRRAAWIAAAAAALTGVFTFYEALILQASLDPFLTAAALVCLTRALTRDRASWFLWAGLVFGVETLNRPNVLLAAMASIAALLAIRHWRGAATVAIGIVLGIAPVTLRNVVVADEWSLLSSHGGLNFYIGNNPNARGGFQVVPGISPSIDGQARDSKVVAERAVGHPLTDAQVSGYFTGLAIAWIGHHPGAAAALFLKKVAYTLNAAHISLDYSYPFFAYDAGTLLRFLCVGPWLLVPLGLVGLVFAAPEARRREYVVVAVFVPAYIVAVAIFFVSDRYRVPLLVPLCVGVGAAVDRIARGIASLSPRRLAWAGATLVLLAIGANWPLGLDEGRGQARMLMTGPSIHRGDLDGAERWAARAIEMHAAPSVVHVHIGEMLLMAGQGARALDHFTQANALDPGRPMVEYRLGQALLATNHPADAIPLLQRGLDGGVAAQVDVPGLPLAYALEATGDRVSAVRVIKTLEPGPADTADVWMSIGRLAGQAQAPDVGEPFLRRAVQMAPDLPSAHELLGMTLVELNRWDDADRELAAAVRLDPHAARAFAYLAACEAQLGRAAEAKADAQTALQLDPSSIVARQVLAAVGK